MTLAFSFSENFLACFWEPEDNKTNIQTPKLPVKNLHTPSGTMQAAESWDCLC